MISEAVLYDADALGSRTREGTQAVVGVRETDTGKDPRQEDTDFQDATTDERDPVVPAKETGAQRHVDVSAEHGSHQRVDVVEVMLPVGVEGDEHVSPAAHAEIEARLQRRALPPVDQMGDDDGSRLASALPGVVTRTVVHDDHVLVSLPHAPDGIGDRGAFVERRDDDEDALPVASGGTGAVDGHH
jgi:hypothetical protein